MDQPVLKTSHEPRTREKDAPLRRTLSDRGVVLGGIAALTILCWLYLFRLARGMEGAMGAGTGVGVRLEAWSGAELLLLFGMWATMMVAMMLPSATPMIALFDTMAERRRSRGRRHAPTAVFVSGYLLAWTGFSVLATLAQWGLHRAALLSPMMVTTSSVLGGLILITAGLYQWTPLKGACLESCRSPLGWLTSQWREGTAGALVMGLRHGGYCVGCCWALMALLFVAGVMNLLWVAALALLVLLEKTVPRGVYASKALGVLLVCWGGWVLVTGPG